MNLQYASAKEWRKQWTGQDKKNITENSAVDT